jgi:energy-coupling factor transport system permease protein
MIELTRTITFGQYINNNSALTRMDPRAKLLCAILLITLFSIIHTFTAFALCFLLCFVIQHISRISPLYILRGFKPFLPFLLFIYVLQVLFYRMGSQGQTIYWHWEFLSISQEGLLASASIMVRVLFLYYCVSMLMFTTTLVDLTDGLEALLSPLQRIGIPVNVFVMVLIIALKFVPILLTEIERLVKAQTARGVRFDQGNFIQRTRKLAPLLIPLFVSGFKRAQSLSIAMEARCYGSHPGWHRSKRRALRFQRFDTFTLIITTCWSLIVLLVSLVVPL